MLSNAVQRVTSGGERNSSCACPLSLNICEYLALCLLDPEDETYSDFT